MKRLFLVLMMIGLAATVAAQDCYTSNRSKGIEAFNNKRYDEAISYFNQATKCAPRTNDLDRQIQRCVDEKRKLARKRAQEAAKENPEAGKVKAEGSATTRTTEVVQPTPPPEPPKPEVKVMYTRYESNCTDGLAGSSLTMWLSVKNMQGKRLMARCYMSPETGGTQAVVANDPRGKYTVFGGRSGQQKEFIIIEEEDYFSATFFVPYSVMDLKGNYGEQMLKTDLYVYEEIADPSKENMKVFPGAEAHESFPLHPVTITVNGGTKDVTVPVDYGGGMLDLNITTCDDNLKWGPLPDWIRVDLGGVQVSENTAPESREAVLHVGSANGGPSIAIRVVQEGLTLDKIEAKVNEVKLEEHVVDNSYGAEVLKMHLSIDIKGAQGRKMKAVALFYADDGVTPLMDKYGKEVRGQGLGTINSSNAWFDDFVIRAYYNHFVNAVNLLGNEAFIYIGISFDDGETWTTRSGPYKVTW